MKYFEIVEAATPKRKAISSSQRLSRTFISVTKKLI